MDIVLKGLRRALFELYGIKNNCEAEDYKHGVRVMGEVINIIEREIETVQ